jgi:hypothetical protein
MNIKKLEINSFRGIPNKLSITFPKKNGRPASLIILGDNGVGKSSVVDSIEFCLQGHILQSKSLDLATSPSVRSFYNQTLPDIKVTLENDEVINRKIIDDEQGLLSNIKNPHKLFSVSPFVLRRHDILRFIDSSEAERTLVFSNYLREENSVDWVEHPIDEIKRLQDERLAIKNQRDSLIKTLANELKMEVESIPFNRKEFHEFVKEKVYKGISKSQMEAKGFKVKLNERAIQLADDVFAAMENHRKIKSQINAFSVNAKITTFPKHLLTQLELFLVKVSEKLTTSFLQISPLPFLERIEIKYDNKSVLALSLILILKNKRRCNPNQLLSEANLDLLALLFFLSFIQESAERGQSKFIILDDVLQSVDATIRVSFVSYLLKNFPDWQYIITAHDRLWHRQLIELMNLYGHPHFNLAITGWTFENGPEIKSIATGIDDSLKEALQEKNLLNICANSGLLLEELSDALSKSLSTSIHRKRDDKYTLADLLPGIMKQLKKTTLKNQVETIEQWIHLRNLIGAHFNEWALALSLDEARQFGESVIKLFEEVKCKKCSSWISNNAELNFYSCKCGTILIQKK